MPSSYPGAVKSWTPLVDNVDEAQAADVNTIYDEVTAIETKLGVNVQGSATNLVTRLSYALSAYGKLSFPNPTELTISSGSITAVYNFHSVDTQGDTASDDLDTIVAPAATENWVLFFHIANDARNIILKHNSGNIYLPGGRDITLDLTSDLAILVYDQVLSKWVGFALTGAGLLGGTNTWTGYNYFNGGTAGKSTTIIAGATLDNTYRTVRVDSTSGNITVALPAAATYPGIEYWIRKIVAANTVTIDPDGSETIDGATTKALTSQWQSVHIQSNGTSWDILAVL